MSEEKRHDPLAKVATARRDFLKKTAIAAAFAAPTIATFSLDGMRKKAFAQAAYDQPEVIAFTAAFGQAVVTFSRAMNTSAGADSTRIMASCRTTTFSSGPVAHTWAWSGNDKQVITFPGCLSSTSLTVTYNQGACGDKFVDLNGLELLPYSGTITVENPC